MAGERSANIRDVPGSQRPHVREEPVPIPGKKKRKANTGRARMKSVSALPDTIEEARSSLRSNPLFRMTPISGSTTTDSQPSLRPARPAHSRRRSADYIGQGAWTIQKELGELLGADFESGTSPTDEIDEFDDDPIFSTDEDLEMHDIAARRRPSRG